MKKSILFTSVATVVLFSGCSQHMGNFTAMSTDAYNVKNIDSAHMVKSNIENEVSSLMILGIPIGGRIKLDQAVSETAHKNGGDFLKNVQVHNYYWTVFLFGKNGYKIKGDVFKTQD